MNSTSCRNKSILTLRVRILSILPCKLFSEGYGKDSKRKLQHLASTVGIDYILWKQERKPVDLMWVQDSNGLCRMGGWGGGDEEGEGDGVKRLWNTYCRWGSYNSKEDMGVSKCISFTYKISTSYLKDVYRLQNQLITFHLYQNVTCTVMTNFTYKKCHRFLNLKWYSFKSAVFSG